MATVHDVAAYIIGKQGQMTTMKLEKLAYYSQAWHLAWDGRPLFAEPIEAWMNGPVVPDLYKKHRGQFLVSEWPSGNPDALEPNERETVDAVLEGYGPLSPSRLSTMTHEEAPWRAAREGLAPTERGGNEISLDLMQEFYDATANTH
jgi:uncharacterized phage-associated protein